MVCSRRGVENQKKIREAVKKIKKKTKPHKEKKTKEESDRLICVLSGTSCAFGLN
jgi:hypothetical protein